jgi:ABC-2 type transport system permease protein
LAFFIIMVLMISLMPLSLLLGGSLDMGQFGACLLGLCLVLASFTAIGLFLSSLTAYPTVAGVSTFGVLLLLWIIDWAGSTGGDGVSGLFAYVSIMRHFQPLLKGVFNSADIIYYVLLSILFLILTVWRLDLDRLQS